MCKEFAVKMLKAMSFANSLKYVMTIWNTILRMIVIYAVTWVGYDTQTAQLERVTVVTFLCQFFYTAWILLLVNADLSEQPFSFGITQGQNGDFNQEFFK